MSLDDNLFELLLTQNIECFGIKKKIDQLDREIDENVEVKRLANELHKANTSYLECRSHLRFESESTKLITLLNEAQTLYLKTEQQIITTLASPTTIHHKGKMLKFERRNAPLTFDQLHELLKEKYPTLDISVEDLRESYYDKYGSLRFSTRGHNDLQAVQPKKRKLEPSD